MIAVPIGPRVQRFATAASPAYLDRRGRPEHPRELLGHDCLRGRFADRATPTWEFERDGEIVRVDPTGPLLVRLGGGDRLAVDAAIGGVGIVQSFRRVVASASRQRRARADPRAMVAELLGSVPLLLRSPPRARAAAGVRRLRQGVALNGPCPRVGCATNGSRARWPRLGNNRARHRVFCSAPGTAPRGEVDEKSFPDRDRVPGLSVDCLCSELAGREGVL